MSEGSRAVGDHDLSGVSERLVRDQAAKADRLRESGVDPYARSYQPRTPAGEIIAGYGHLAAGEETEDRFRIAGRVMAGASTARPPFSPCATAGTTCRSTAASTLWARSPSRASATSTWATSSAARATCSAPGGASSSLFAESWTLLTKSLRPLPEKFHGLQDARPATASATSTWSPTPRWPGSFAGARQARLVHAPLPGEPGLRRGRDAHPAAAPRRRAGPSVRHAPQRARHRPLPAHRPRAVPQAVAGGRLRQDLRDRASNFRNEGISLDPQPRVHHDGALLGLRGLQRHHGAGGEHDQHAGAGGHRHHGDRRWASIPWT